MKNIFKIFELLAKNKLSNKNNGGIETAPIPKIKHHKIGISEEGYPTFFIKCKDASNPVKQISLQIISVNLNVSCQLYTNGVLVDDGIYAQIILKSESWDLIKHFINIVSSVLETFKEIEDSDTVKGELDKIISLFSRLSGEPQKTIQVLWAELLLIENSNDPEYLISAWHVKSNDKYDFNDGIDKIEVKSTEKTKREHHFSIEQLTTTTNSHLLVASFMVYESGIGTTVFDIVELIKNRVTDSELKLKLDAIVAESLGTNFELAFEKFYDYDYGFDNRKFYDSEMIPTIAGINIPNTLSQVNFIADLSTVQSIDKITYSSKLHGLINL
jgi:hypothetical protein